MPVYGEGECLYGLMKICRLGDKGIREVNPIYCLNCIILKLTEALEEIAFPPENDVDPTEELLH